MAFDPISLALSKGYTESTAEGMGALVGPAGPKGDPGADATINGVNVLELVEGENITLEQQGDILTISAVGGGEAAEAGDGLSKEGSTLSVDNPVRGILTQAEYDALPEEQKAKGTYFVDGGSGDFGGGAYSTGEQRIGTWIDGKPLYRRIWFIQNFLLPGGIGAERTILEGVPAEYEFKYINAFTNLNLTFQTSNIIYRKNLKAFSINNNYASTDQYINIIITSKYTKTTDQATIQLPAALTVDMPTYTAAPQSGAAAELKADFFNEEA